MYKCPDCGVVLKVKGNHWWKHVEDRSIMIENCRRGGKSCNHKIPHPGGEGHPMYYSREYLGDRFDEVEADRRRKIGVTSVEHWKDPEYRAKILPASEKAQQDEARREKCKITCAEVGKKNKGKAPSNKGRKMGEEFSKKCRESNLNPSPARIEGRKRATPKKKMYRGPLASNWQDGRSQEEYGKDWTEDLREFVRNRDGYACRLCTVNEYELTGMFNKKLDVHHMDRDKSNGDIWNLVALCRSCHSRLQEHARSN